MCGTQPTGPRNVYYNYNNFKYIKLLNLCKNSLFLYILFCIRENLGKDYQNFDF